MTKQNEFTWKTKNGQKIYGHQWNVEEAKGVVCLVHGLGEHMRRYDSMAAYYNERGYVMVAFDNLGHGKSEGKRGHTPSFRIYMDNVKALLEKADKLYPLLPKFLYGHSMGGNLVLNYVLRNNPSIAGVISTGAWILLPKPPSALLVGFGKIMRHILPSLLQPNNLDVESISTDEAEVAKYINDPLVHNKISVNAGVEMLEAAKWLEEYHGPINMPVLLMHAGDDHLTSPKGTALLAKNLNGDVTHREWKGMYHEIHNEVNRKNVYDFIIKWMEIKIVKWGEIGD